MCQLVRSREGLGQRLRTLNAFILPFYPLPFGSSSTFLLVLLFGKKLSCSFFGTPSHSSQSRFWPVLVPLIQAAQMRFGRLSQKLGSIIEIIPFTPYSVDKLDLVYSQMEQPTLRLALPVRHLTFPIAALTSLCLAWVAAYPAGTPDADAMPQAWKDALSAAVQAGKIPNIPPSSVPNNGSPVYPPGFNPYSPQVCSGTYKCRITGDVWDAPPGVIGISFDDGPLPVSVFFHLHCNNVTRAEFTRLPFHGPRPAARIKRPRISCSHALCF